MTPTDWKPVIAKGGNITKTATALGMDRDSIAAYVNGKATPRKVALAVAAYMDGLEPYGEVK